MDEDAAYMERVDGCLRSPQKKSHRTSRKRIFCPEAGSPRWLVYTAGNGQPVGLQKRMRTEHSWLGVLAANGNARAQKLYAKFTKRPETPCPRPYWLDERLPPSRIMDQRYDFTANVPCLK